MAMFKNHLSLVFSMALALATGIVSFPALAGTVPVGPTPAATSITATIVFKVKHQKKLKRYIQQTATPGPHYRDFLSVREFVVHYAPHKGQLKQVARYLNSFGITEEKVFDDHLAITVSGPASAFEQAFRVQLQDYQHTGPGRSRGHFHRPKHQPHMPKLLRGNDVLTIVGLSNQYQHDALHISTRQLKNNDKLNVVPKSGSALATHTPGQYTVQDVANLYNINPLYNEGITGKNTTVGVATYADFKPEDARTYWNLINLNYKHNRITQIHVDGGGNFGAAAGTGETSLDVEQSGGLAPFANIVVYDAPNSTEGGIHMFYQIVSDNKVDSLSYSWGLPEIFYYPQLNGGVDERPTFQAQNQAFMEAAAQGISLFAASGDSGAYDTNRSLPYPSFSKVVSVDAPGSSPYMTAAGGTTLPISLHATSCAGQDQPYYATVKAERPWAWDYLSGLYKTCYGLSPVQAGIFSVGGGGGVSVYWPRPLYQNGIAGMRNSAPDQTLIDYTVSPPEDIIHLPAGFAGRNVPDISMDADPETGFLVYDTPDGGLISGYGGTSFVAPQLNGITALINQRTGGRVGFMNPQLYRLLDQYGYGPNSPFNDIARKDNWYWHGVPGYDPAVGIGTPNVARLAEVLAENKGHGNNGSHGKH